MHKQKSPRDTIAKLSKWIFRWFSVKVSQKVDYWLSIHYRVSPRWNLVEKITLLCDKMYILCVNTHLRPAIISMAELKLPMFQQLWATLSKHDSSAWRSSRFDPFAMTWLVHVLTCGQKTHFSQKKNKDDFDFQQEEYIHTSLKRSMRLCTLTEAVEVGQQSLSSVWVELLVRIGPPLPKWYCCWSILSSRSCCCWRCKAAVRSWDTCRKYSAGGTW